MNASLLLLASSIASGGDVIPAGWGDRPPSVVHAGGCPATSCCDPCASAGRVKLLDRFKAKAGARDASCCGPSGSTYNPPNLLDKLRSRANSCCPPVNPCAPGIPPTPVSPPKEMPKPKEFPQGSTSVVPSPASIAFPLPMPPAPGPRAGSPY